MSKQEKIGLSDLIIDIHKYARSIEIDNPKEGFAVRLLADDLAKIGNEVNEKIRKLDE
jgi:hypothetical protein